MLSSFQRVVARAGGEAQVIPVWAHGSCFIHKPNPVALKRWSARNGLCGVLSMSETAVMDKPEVEEEHGRGRITATLTRTTLHGAPPVYRRGCFVRRS